MRNLTPAERIEWCLRNFEGEHIMSTSFGAQSVALIHLMTSIRPDIPVVFIDTGYLFPETYRYADALTERMGLNLHVYRADISPAWQEARHGARWAKDVDGMVEHNRETKVDPMCRALRELNAGTWFSGIRRQQSPTRARLGYSSGSGNCMRAHPIWDWTDEDVRDYIDSHDLPAHPLKGYTSIGDVQTTSPDARFDGLMRECGLHEVA